MATLVFQAHEQSSIEEDFSALQQEVEELILKQLELLKTSSRNWTIFRVARQATRLVSFVHNLTVWLIPPPLQT